MYILGDEMLIKSTPNRWSCVPAAFATAINVEVQTLIEKIGHDGSEIIFPDLEEPLCRRAFHVQELCIALFSLGYFVSGYDCLPLALCDEDHMYTVEYPDEKALFKEIMSNSIGVGCGRIQNTNTTHAFAWNGERCYDPQGFIYPLSRYELYSYNIITKR